MTTLCNTGPAAKGNEENHKKNITNHTQLNEKYSSLLNIFYAKGYDKVILDYYNGIVEDEKLLEAAKKMQEEMLSISWQMAEISNEALREIKTDSTNYDINKLVEWYNVINTIDAKYSLEETYYQMQEYDKSYSILKSIPETFKLDEYQYKEHSNYLSYFDLKHNIHKSGRTYLDMKEDEINKLVDIAKANTGASSLMAQSVSNGNNAIDTSSLPNGVYVYKVVGKDGAAATGKWIKM